MKNLFVHMAECLPEPRLTAHRGNLGTKIMKITKQRLKEIIKEELESVQEDYTPEERAVMGADKRFKRYLAKKGVRLDMESIRNHLESEGLNPRVAIQYALFAADIFGDPQPLPQRPILGTPLRWLGDVEEAIQSGGKLPKPEAEHSEVSYDSTPETRKAFHKKARKVAKQGIKKGEIEEGWGWRDDDDDRPKTNKEKRAGLGIPEPEEEEKTLKLPKYDPETRERFQKQQSQKRDLARHKRQRGLKSKAGI